MTQSPVGHIDCKSFVVDDAAPPIRTLHHSPTRPKRHPCRVYPLREPSKSIGGSPMPEPLPFPTDRRPRLLPDPEPDNLDRALALLDEIGGKLATVALMLIAEM